MISLETTHAFLGEIANKTDENVIMAILSDFAKKEPYVMSFLSIVCANEAVKNPVTAALLAVSVYEKMRISQQEAERLNRELG
jgi:hypothetical protein